VHGGATPLIQAALRGHFEAVELLLGEGADKERRDDYGRTPLLLVARETGDVRMARVLIEAGAEVDARDRFGETPLDLASWRGFGPLVDLLLESGAGLPETPAHRGKMLTHAAQHGLDSLFHSLAEKHADLELRGSRGGSLLHWASEGGSEAIVELLLEHGLAIDEQDRYGWSPLHYAAKRGRLAAAAALLERGAEMELRTLAGSTPRNVAQEFGRAEIVRLLEEAGAETSDAAFPLLVGPYMGQAPPADEPLLFAPGIVSSNRFEHGTVTFSGDGCEAFWTSSYLPNGGGYTRSRILTSKLEGGRWSAPAAAAFSGPMLGDDVPHFSPDGERLYFLSTRAFPGVGGGEKLWFVERGESGWSEPHAVRGGPNAMRLHWQFSVASSGNVYFSADAPGGHGSGDLYVSRRVDGAYQEPQNLGSLVNSEHAEGSPFVAPDESYLLITRSGHPEGLGDGDLCVSFRDADGRWGRPVNLPSPVNSASRDMCPQVTRDGRYLFFNSRRNGGADNYWVSARILEELRPD
jgi:ankyrin repeat protein